MMLLFYLALQRPLDLRLEKSRVQKMISDVINVSVIRTVTTLTLEALASKFSEKSLSDSKMFDFFDLFGGHHDFAHDPT